MSRDSSSLIEYGNRGPVEDPAAVVVCGAPTAQCEGVGLLARRLVRQSAAAILASA
jgi:hypothetical protein